MNNRELGIFKKGSECEGSHVLVHLSVTIEAFGRHLGDDITRLGLKMIWFQILTNISEIEINGSF